MAELPQDDTRWIARVIPAAGSDIDSLLRTSLGLDVWERRADTLVVQASDGQLRELERRRLATVERYRTVGEFLADKESGGEESAT